MHRARFQMFAALTVVAGCSGAELPGETADEATVGASSGDGPETAPGSSGPGDVTGDEPTTSNAAETGEAETSATSATSVTSATSDADTGAETGGPSTTGGGDDDTGDTGDTGEETGAPPLEEARIIGYFPAWAVYARDFHVADIAADKLTHINYAFANLSADGKCVLGDAYADIDKFYEGDSWDEGALRGSFHQLQKLKEKHPKLRTMISVGGWTWSGNFSPAAATAAGRAALAESCVTFMREYGFDGVDIDWEYPVGGGLEGNQSSPADKHNYTLLLAELRAQLDAAQAQDGKTYELSIAAPAGPSTIANLELAEIHKHLSWINVMAYDFFGGWSPQTDFNAPLYASADTAESKAMNVDAAVQAYLGAGVPGSKLVVGVPFYGRGFTGAQGGDNGLHTGYKGMPMGTWEAGVFDYKDLVDNYIPKYTRHWHEGAQVPWLYDPATGLMISYDDEQSIAIKAQYIRGKALGGAMAWDLSGDAVEGSLLAVVHAELLE